MPTLTHALAGQGGSLKKNGTPYPFKSWRLKLSCAALDVTNFLSEGFSEIMAGIKSGELTAQGLLVPELQLTLGERTTFSLGAGTDVNGIAYGITFTGVVLDITPSTAVDKPAEIEVMLRTSGSFTLEFAVAA